MAEAGRAPLDDAALLAGLRGALGAGSAWLVGGAVRDRLLGRVVSDVDLVVPDPAAAARAIRGALGGTLFALSERHGAWRLTLDDGRTVDTSPLGEGIEADLARRDFTVNAMAAPLDGGPLLDPHGGALDLEQRVLRPVSDGAFRDDPVRLLRAVRFECELGLGLDAGAEALVRRDAALVARPAGERLLAELERLKPAGFRRLGELGLLDPLGGSPALLDAVGREPTSDLLLVAVFGHRLAELPIPGELRRMAQRVLSAEPPPDAGLRAIHRFRRRSEPWAVEALLLARRPELVDAVEAARAVEPAEPLLRGDELGIPPGPRVGALLERIAEERAAGTIASREEALAFVARLERETERGHE